MPRREGDEFSKPALSPDGQIAPEGGGEWRPMKEGMGWHSQPRCPTHKAHAPFKAVQHTAAVETTIDVSVPSKPKLWS